MIVAGAVEYGHAVRLKVKLQRAADAGAMAAAKELALSDTRTENLAAIVNAVVNNHMAVNNPAGHTSVVVETALKTDPLEVQVRARQAVNSLLGNLPGVSFDEVAVDAVARIIGKPNICVLALEDSELGAIWLEKRARMTGTNCAVFSNSTSSLGLTVRNNAVLEATSICTAGGREGGQGNYNPQPYLDCPQFDDPLANRPEPTVGPCTHQGMILADQIATLSPGVYCGGLVISGASQVRLEAGEYIIKDGELRVDDTASLTGDGVGFFLTGANARFIFTLGTTIDLSAPRSGTMAGLLFFSARNQSRWTTNWIRSDNARRLIGTIYLPNAILRVDAEKPVGDQSAYTAIVARKITLFEGPHLMLNTSYSDTDVPVPDGVKGVGQPVQLVK